MQLFQVLVLFGLLSSLAFFLMFLTPTSLTNFYLRREIDQLNNYLKKNNENIEKAIEYIESLTPLSENNVLQKKVYDLEKESASQSNNFLDIIKDSSALKQELTEKISYLENIKYSQLNKKLNFKHLSKLENESSENLSTSGEQYSISSFIEQLDNYSAVVFDKAPLSHSRIKDSLGRLNSYQLKIEEMTKKILSQYNELDRSLRI